MDHDEAAPLLGAYAVHALDRNEDSQVAAHLDACARCHAEVSQYQRILGLLGGSEVPGDT